VFERSLLIKKRLHYKSITVLSLYVAPHYLRQAGFWASAKGGQASRPSKLKTKKATQWLLFCFLLPLLFKVATQLLF
jgi:hypothetical protein